MWSAYAECICRRGVSDGDGVACARAVCERVQAGNPPWAKQKRVRFGLATEAPATAALPGDLIGERKASRATTVTEEVASRGRESGVLGRRA